MLAVMIRQNAASLLVEHCPAQENTLIINKLTKNKCEKKMNLFLKMSESLKVTAGLMNVKKE